MNDKKILITGGAVHGKLDDVKLITNKFKGGRIASLAMKLSKYYKVIYLTSKGSILPTGDNIDIIYHDGVYDYMEQVIKISPSCEAVILGGAIANLIPVEPFEGKFPSHNYKSGDIINIPFQIAPRIVDKVKEVAPYTKLFAYKLLSNVSYDELINAAYDIVLESKATAVFANDVTDLNTKYAVTKEKSIIPLKEENYHEFIIDAIEDEYFKTEITKANEIDSSLLNQFNTIYEKYKDEFNREGDYLFGTIAIRTENNSFITTTRGKNEFEDIAYVSDVDFINKIVYSNKKASLNAPLLFNLFKNNPNINIIIHTHNEHKGYKTLKYSIPGTLRDSNIISSSNFNIQYHGSFELKETL